MASSAAGSVADLAAKQAARQAAEAASKAAAKAASKAAAEAAQSATKAASKAAADAAQSAAEAAAKAAKAASDEAASLAAKAAKSGDSASQSAATAAAKRADDLAKKAADARTVADDAAAAADDVAGAGAKGSKGVSKTTVAAGLLTAGAVAGGLYYIDKELKDASEDIKDCMKICLPENWDEYIYGENVKKSALVYRDIEDPGEDQPLCTKKIKDCGDFCKKKCTEIHKADLPGAGIIRGAGDAAGDLFDRLNPFKGFGEILGNIAYGFLIFIIILVVLGAAYMAYKATRRS